MQPVYYYTIHNLTSIIFITTKYIIIFMKYAIFFDDWLHANAKWQK